MPTQHTYVFNATIPGIEYAGAGVTWTIAKGVLVGSHDESGVLSGYAGSKLINKGQALSADSVGVKFKGDGSTIVNDASGSIVGSDGINTGNFNNKDITVTNHGIIEGYAATGVFSSDTSNFVLTNNGDIYGHLNGVYLFSYTAGLAVGPVVDNSGMIRSDQHGIRVTTIPALTTTVINENGGTIKGGFQSIFTDGGALSLDNKGTMKGDIACAASGAKDKIVNAGTIKGAVDLGSGNDVYKNDGGKAGKVDGGLGNDKLVCGSGADKLVFDTTLNATTNVDTVKHFDPGKDMLYLDTAIFTMLTGPGTLKGTEFHVGKHAGDSDDYIIYNKHTGALYYDADGNGGGSPQVEFAHLDKHLNLHHDDFTVFA
jgi:hypothetical protein